jgi:predicted metal-dependent phosphoesterase TrpH
MRRIALVVAAVGIAAAVLVPAQRDPEYLELRCIDGVTGRDEPCVTEFAHVVVPDREKPTPWALPQDLAYAAAAAGPEGCAWLLIGLAVIAMVLGLWNRGLLGGVRRLLLVLALGVPLCFALFYGSCFLDGRQIRLGKEAAGEWLIASLHSQTDRTTGLLSPSDVVAWHYQRGFRILNVSDRNEVRAGEEALAFARREGFTPPMLVLVGEEWHVHPDLVLVNVKRAREAHHLADDELKATVADVKREGGLAFVAHPWAKLDPRTLDAMLAGGVDGVEVVNGVIHGGSLVIEAARRHKKAMVGVIDYKYGPHVNAVTLLKASRARTAAGVVAAIRERDTRVLYAVPGGTTTGAAYEAADLGVTGAAAGLRALIETPRSRRATWLVWLALIAGLWWLTTREPEGGAPKSMSRGQARVLFVVCCVIELAVPAGASWEVRGTVGTIPVGLLLCIAAVVAVPLLAAAHTLARTEAR